MERLDRAVGNELWITSYPNYHVSILPRLTSDHCPILLDLDAHNSYKAVRPFRFEPMWMMESSFKILINKEWSGNIFPLQGKIQKVCEAMINWNKTIFGNIFKKKKNVLARIEGV